MCEASAANHKMSRVPSRTTRFNFNNIYTDLLSWKKEIKEFPPISNSRLRVFETLGFVPKIETKVKIFSYAKIIGGYIFIYLSSWIFVSKYWARIEESLLLLADIFTFVLESNVFHSSSLVSRESTIYHFTSLCEREKLQNAICTFK